MALREHHSSVPGNEVGLFPPGSFPSPSWSEGHSSSWRAVRFVALFLWPRHQQPEVKEGLDETLENAFSLALSHQQLFRALQLLWHEYD